MRFGVQIIFGLILSTSSTYATEQSALDRYQVILKKATEPYEECDRQQSSKVIEVLKMLQMQSANLRNLKLPPRQKEQKQTKNPSTPEQSLVTRYESWEKAYQKMLNLKNTTPLSNPVDWFNLLSYSEHLLFHDHLRIVGGYNYQVDHSVATLGPIAYAEIQRCLSQPSCETLNFSSQIQKLLFEKEKYKYSWQAYLEQDGRERRTWIGLLEYHLGSDLRLLGFSPNPTVERRGNKWILPLDAGDFQNQKERIEKAVAENWQGEGGLVVQIQWSQQTASSPAVYKLVRSSSQSGNAHVDEEQALIFLNDVLSHSEVAHEIGHALGFRDHYYRSWDLPNCRYKDEFDLSDLMSYPESGSVTQNHWLNLKHFYQQTH